MPFPASFILFPLLRIRPILLPTEELVSAPTTDKKPDQENQTAN